MKMLEDRKSAYAFACFLLWERSRHLDDIKVIDRKLKLLDEQFGFDISLDEYIIDGLNLSEDVMWISEEDIKAINNG